MISLSTIEVNSKGKVLSVAAPATYLLNGLFPNEDGNITSHYDNHTNELIKERLEVIFNSSVSIEFPITINNHPLQCTAHHYADDKAFLYFKHIEQSVSDDLQYVILKKNEAARLKLAEFSFQNVYSPIAFIREDGSFLYFNEATATLFGYSMEEFHQLTVFDINPTYNPAQWQYQWDEIRNNIKLTLFSKLQKQDGSWMDVEVRTNMISFGDQELNCTFYTDITEKKKIEEQLKLVDFTFRHATTPILLINDDNTIYDFNEAIPFMLGYTKEEFKSITILDLDPYNNKEGWATLWTNLKTMKALELQRKLKRKDGSLIDVEMSINLIKYGETELNCAFITDVTENKKLLEKLKLVDFAFNNSSTAIILVKEDGTIHDFNLISLSMFGYSKTEMEDLQVFDIDPNASPEVRKKIWENLREAGTTLLHRPFKKKDGTWMDVEVKADIVTYGGVEYNCAFITDITERRTQEEHLNIVDFTFQHASTAILLLREDGTFYDFNLATLSLFGYTKEEMKDLNVFDVEPDASQETRKPIWENIRASKNLLLYKKLKRKDGTWRNLEVRCNLVKKGNLELNCAFIIDITDKKKIEERLKLLEKVVTETNQSIVITDATEGMNNPIIYANEAFTNITGYSVQEVKGTNPRFLHKGRDVRDDEGRITMRHALKNFIPWRVTVINTKKNGDHYWADIAGFPVFDDALGKYSHWVAIQSDITEKKNEELRLKLLESVVTNTRDSILITEAEPFDLPGPRILFVNPAFEKMTGYTSEEIIGKTPRILQNEDTDKKELDRLHTAMRNWQPCEITVSNSKKNGEKFWINFTIAPVANEKGWFTHWIAVERDVTKEKEAAVEKEHMLDELIENNKELIQFSYITTHNLRAPLTNLISICKKIDTKFIEDEMTVKLIEGFKQSTSLLNDTLDDLIKILIIKENRHIVIAECVFEETLEKIKASISTILLKNVVKIEADFSEATTVSFVCIYLESIFLNLLTNAIKYSHPTRYPIVKIKTFKDANGCTKLTFSDNGRGMNMERVKNKIFGLYQRFHSNADGKGIGLYLIHSQITALGGKIEVESEEGVGTMFTITFK